MSGLVVVFPMYRPLTPLEQVSQDRCRDVARRNGIERVIVCPERVPPVEGFGRVVLADRHFESLQSYNALMLSAFFYRLFDAAEHILVHQADAFMFGDDFRRFLEWDYVGAPWTIGTMGRPRGRVGNGGLSLRRVQVMLDVIAGGHAERWPLTHGEDLFWGIEAADMGLVRVAPEMEAARFSLEYEPGEYIAKTGVLPVGCHAWNTSPKQLEFWRPLMATLGYVIPQP